MESSLSHCLNCNSTQVKVHTRYQTVHYGEHQIYHCRNCNTYFSGTMAMPISGLRTPLSRVIEILRARNNGVGLNAVARNFSVSKKSIIDWERRLSDLKPILLLYDLLHQFLSQFIEDEFYSQISKNVIVEDSQNWVILLMERGSQFLQDINCGRKDKQLFESALNLLAKVAEQTGDLTLLSDGECRYSNVLFSICHQLLSNKTPKKSRKLLPKVARIRLKRKNQKKRQRKHRSTCEVHNADKFLAENQSLCQKIDGLITDNNANSISRLCLTSFIYSINIDHYSRHFRQWHFLIITMLYTLSLFIFFYTSTLYSYLNTLSRGSRTQFRFYFTICTRGMSP